MISFGHSRYCRWISLCLLYHLSIFYVDNQNGSQQFTVWIFLSVSTWTLVAFWTRSIDMICMKPNFRAQSPCKIWYLRCSKMFGTLNQRVSFNWIDPHLEWKVCHSIFSLNILHYYRLTPNQQWLDISWKLRFDAFWLGCILFLTNINKPIVVKVACFVWSHLSVH